MTEIPSEAYLAGHFFGRDGRHERRFNAVADEINRYANGVSTAASPLALPRNGATRSSTSVA